MIVSFSEAAMLLGFKSRSRLYHLRSEGHLDGYLCGPSGRGQKLETVPDGLPSLRERVESLTRLQLTNVERKRPAPDPRWELAAADLSEALAAGGCDLSLTAKEAKVLAAAVPGLATPAPDLSFWAEYGRVEPAAEPLPDAEFWQHVAQMTNGMVTIDGPLTGPQAQEVHRVMVDAMAEVEHGARWDQHQWDAASARTALPDARDGCQLSRQELVDLLEGGRLPDELAAEVREVLAQS
jgi:hypothetical protein